MPRLLLIAAMAAALVACGASTATTGADGSGGLHPSGSATQAATLTPSPAATPDEHSAYRAEVCELIDPLVVAVGTQMGPALDAVFEDDRQAAARERTRLDVIVGDLLAALESGPDFAGARTLETRLEASVSAFQSGLDAAEEGDFEAAAGFFEVGGELFADAKAEFAEVCE